MSKQRGRWPLPRTAAFLLSAVAGGLVLAGSVPASRAGLFLLAAASLTGLLAFRRLTPPKKTP